MNVKNWLEFIECGCILRMDVDKYLVGWGARSWMESPGDSSSPSFYFPDFFLSKALPWFQHEETAIVSYDELMRDIPPSSASDSRFIWTNPYLKQFENAFDELKTHITQGTLKKAVPYVFDESHLTMNKTHLVSSLTRLLSFTRAQPLHVYGFWDEKEGILGASPEILFKYKNDGEGLLETVAVAGTKSNADIGNDFINDPKETFEHQVVVEGIKESLAPFGQVQTGKMQVLKLPKLSHLMTPIEVSIQGKMNFSSIVHALHPTPALGAFPRLEGMKWLQAYQKKMPRERYGAPLGYLLEGGKQAKCIVGIRNIQWDPQGSKIGAGCGVVSDSRLDKEWQEIGLKIASIKELLSI